MLTKSDLSAIKELVNTSIHTETRKIVREELGSKQTRSMVREELDSKENRSVIREESQSVIEEALAPIKIDIKSIKQRVRKIHKTTDVMAKLFDRADVGLHKRVKRIETHLNFPPQAA